MDEDWQWLVEQLQQPENKQQWEQLQAAVETAAVETAAAAVKAAAAKAKEAARKKLQRCKKKKKTVDS